MTCDVASSTSVTYAYKRDVVFAEANIQLTCFCSTFNSSRPTIKYLWTAAY